MSRRACWSTILMALLMLGCTAGPLAASHEGLVRAADSPHIFWVDRFGIRHHIVSTDALRAYFGRAPVAQISLTELLSIPRGGQIDSWTPPAAYDARRDRTAHLERLWRPRHHEWGRRPWRGGYGYGGFVPRRYGFDEPYRY